MTTTLHEKRFSAAVASKGISAGPIYQMTLNLIRDLGVKGDMLEFGAGTGSLIGQLSGYEGTITGADILARPDALPPEVRWLHVDLNNPLPTVDESFDVIVTTEVIEHLENPRAAFREFFRLLRPKGVLILTTPNQESIRSLAGVLFGGHFTAFLGRSYPAHITALLRLDFTRIANEAGFKSTEFYYTDFGGLPKMPNLRWQKLSFGLLKGRLFSDNIGVVARKA